MKSLNYINAYTYSKNVPARTLTAQSNETAVAFPIGT